MHPSATGIGVSNVNNTHSNQERVAANTSSNTNEVAIDGTTVTGAGERVCLSAVPLKVLAKNSSSLPVGTYALLDIESEVTLCHNELQEQLVTGDDRFI